MIIVYHSNQMAPCKYTCSNIIPNTAYQYVSKPLRFRKCKSALERALIHAPGIRTLFICDPTIWKPGPKNTYMYIYISDLTKTTVAVSCSPPRLSLCLMGSFASFILSRGTKRMRELPPSEYAYTCMQASVVPIAGSLRNVLHTCSIPISVEQLTWVYR